MAGVQKLFYLPEPHTDFIFAVIGEELGLIGTTVVLLCFCVIAWRGLRAAMRAPDGFGAFLALGLTMMIVVQAFVNMSVVLGLLPTKGIPLPLVSNGGSSLLINLLALGVLLNISQHAHRAETRSGVTSATSSSRAEARAGICTRASRWRARFSAAIRPRRSCSSAPRPASRRASCRARGFRWS